MSLSQSINQLKDSLYSSGTTGKSIKSALENSFFSDREIAKNIIKSKNPNISEETANTIVYGEKNPKKDDKGKVIKSDDDLDNSLKEIKDKNKKQYRNINSGKSVDKDGNTIPRDKIFDEVSELKTGIINSSFVIAEKSVKLPLDVINLGVMIVNSAPAVAAYTAVGNIPGAINSLLTIKNEVDKLKLHFNELLPHVEMMSKLELVVATSSAPYLTISGLMPILNTSLSSLNSFNLSTIDSKTDELKTQGNSGSSGGGISSYSDQNTGSGGSNTTTTTTTTTQPKIVNINFFYRDRNNSQYYLDITVVSNNSLQLKWPKPNSMAGTSYDNKYYSADQIKRAYNLGVDIANLEFKIDERKGDKLLKINDLQDMPNILDVLSRLSFTYPSY